MPVGEVFVFLLVGYLLRCLELRAVRDRLFLNDVVTGVALEG